MMNKLHGIIFSYLSNPDLRELTQNRNTCSIPYGGRYRVIDFMLSNMVNAGISDVGMIVDANYQSLLDHVGSGKDWDLSRKHGGLRILPPRQRLGPVPQARRPAHPAPLQLLRQTGRDVPGPYGRPGGHPLLPPEHPSGSRGAVRRRPGGEPPPAGYL